MSVFDIALLAAVWYSFWTIGKEVVALRKSQQDLVYLTRDLYRWAKEQSDGFVPHDLQRKVETVVDEAYEVNKHLEKD